MSKPVDYQSEEEEEKPFNVADHLDEPQVIESHIGDLQVEIERLRALLDQVADLAAAAYETAATG